MEKQCGMLILWKSEPVEEATGEEESGNRGHFPNFCLEDMAEI